MDNYEGIERRKNARVQGNFIVSYRVYEEEDAADLTQTKNISGGGMLLTTNRSFSAGVLLVMHIKLPFMENRVDVLGQVVDSREVVKDLIYETRIQFIEVDDKGIKAIDDTVTFYLEKEQD